MRPRVHFLPCSLIASMLSPMPVVKRQQSRAGAGGHPEGADIDGLRSQFFVRHALRSAGCPRQRSGCKGAYTDKTTYPSDQPDGWSSRPSPIGSRRRGSPSWDAPRVAKASCHAHPLNRSLGASETQAAARPARHPPPRTRVLSLCVDEGCRVVVNDAMKVSESWSHLAVKRRSSSSVKPVAQPFPGGILPVLCSAGPVQLPLASATPEFTQGRPARR
jgi:hypothetical protein